MTLLTMFAVFICLFILCSIGSALTSIGESLEDIVFELKSRGDK